VGVAPRRSDDRGHAVARVRRRLAVNLPVRTWLVLVLLAATLAYILVYGAGAA
jgi:type VI protein secretion system component VasF